MLTEKQNGFPDGIEFGEAFRLKIPSSILIVSPSGCEKTCFTESLLLDHLEELFVNGPPLTIHITDCFGAWQDGFRDIKAGEQFHRKEFWNHAILGRGFRKLDFWC